MNNIKRLLKHRKSFVATLFIIGLVMMTACGSSDPNNSNNSGDNESASNDEVFNLKVATFQDNTNVQMAGYHVFAEKIEEESDGRIKIEYVGGPEAIPALNQGEALRNGTIDMAWLGSAYYAETVPEALIPASSELTAEEEIEKGSIDFLSTFHEEKMNTKFIGRAADGALGLLLKHEEGVESMADFEGMEFRGSEIYAPTLEAMGISVIKLPGEEVYQALERGMVDGFAWANYGATDLGVQELITHKIMPDFNNMDIYTLMNLDTWNSLPEDLQQLVEEVSWTAFTEQSKLVEDKIASENEELEANGVEIIELSDGEEFVQMAHDKTWEWLGERVENIDELAKYFRK